MTRERFIFSNIDHYKLKAIYDSCLLFTKELQVIHLSMRTGRIYIMLKDISIVTEYKMQ